MRKTLACIAALAMFMPLFTACAAPEAANDGHHGQTIVYASTNEEMPGVVVDSYTVDCLTDPRSDIMYKFEEEVLNEDGSIEYVYHYSRYCPHK